MRSEGKPVTKTIKPYRWAIIYQTSWGGNGTGYTLVPGRKYKTKAGARNAFERMRQRWDARARSGEIAPSWEGRFEEYGYRLIEIPEGQSLRETVDAIDGAYYVGLAD